MNVLDIYCKFKGWQGGTIHQAMEDFQTLDIKEKDKLCGMLVDNLMSLTDPINARWFMSQRLRSLGL